MGFGSILKKTIKTTAKAAVGQALAPDGILMAACPQLGVANALVKGVTGGQIDPLAIATNAGMSAISGNFKAGDLLNGSGEVLNYSGTPVNVSPSNLASLTDMLKTENMAKINALMTSTDKMIEVRASDRAAHESASNRVVGVDIAQNNIVSQVFHSIVKGLVSSYELRKPNSSLVLSLGMATNASCIDNANWVAPTSYDQYYEDLTDLVRLPLTQTPVSDASVLVSFMNGLLEKLDDDNALIEFLAIFGYAGGEVVCPNIEGRSPLARVCLAAIQKELVYKYMSMWVKGTQNYSGELDFYREIMSEWLGSEISNTHPVYVDMISSAIISLKGYQIARYLLENKCPYLANMSNTFYHTRYAESKDNPYDLLQFARNVLLIAQINYGRSLLTAYTAAAQGIAAYHQYSYVVLSLVVKLLQDATMFNKMCLSNNQLNYITTRFANDDLKYVFEICNDDFAWIDSVDEGSLCEAITTAQIAASNIKIGDGEMSFGEIETALDSVKAALESATEPDLAVCVAYRDRVSTCKSEVIELYQNGEISADSYQTCIVKIDSLISSINGKLS